MERAGEACALRILEQLRRSDIDVAEVPFLVLCGMGNNGGDGLVIARELIGAGAVVRTVIVKHSDRSSLSNSTNLERLKALAASIEEISEGEKIDLRPGELIID